MDKKQNTKFCFFLPIKSKYSNNKIFELSSSYFNKVKGPFPLDEFEGEDRASTLDSVFFDFIQKTYKCPAVQNNFVILSDYGQLFPSHHYVVRYIRNIDKKEIKDSIIIKSKRNKRIAYVAPVPYRHPFVHSITRKEKI